MYKDVLLFMRMSCCVFTYIHTYIGRSYPSTASNRINSNQIKLNAAMSSMSSPPWLLGGILFDVFSCILKKQCACCIHVHKTVTTSVCESRMCLAYFLIGMSSFSISIPFSFLSPLYLPPTPSLSTTVPPVPQCLVLYIQATECKNIWLPMGEVFAN